MEVEGGLGRSLLRVRLLRRWPARCLRRCMGLRSTPFSRVLYLLGLLTKLRWACVEP